MNTASYLTFGNLDITEYAYKGESYEKFSISWNTIIENVIGGKGNDTFYPNNTINIIDGGPGNDKVIYPGSQKDYIITNDGNNILIKNVLSNYNDILINIEEVLFESKINTAPPSMVGPLFLLLGN